MSNVAHGLNFSEAKNKKEIPSLDIWQVLMQEKDKEINSLLSEVASQKYTIEALKAQLQTALMGW